MAYKIEYPILEEEMDKKIPIFKAYNHLRKELKDYTNKFYGYFSKVSAVQGVEFSLMKNKRDFLVRIKYADGIDGHTGEVARYVWTAVDVFFVGIEEFDKDGHLITKTLGEVLTELPKYEKYVEDYRFYLRVEFGAKFETPYNKITFEYDRRKKEDYKMEYYNPNKNILIEDLSRKNITRSKWSPIMFFLKESKVQGKIENDLFFKSAYIGERTYVNYPWGDVLKSYIDNLDKLSKIEKDIIYRNCLFITKANIEGHIHVYWDEYFNLSNEKFIQTTNDFAKEIEKKLPYIPLEWEEAMKEKDKYITSNSIKMESYKSKKDIKINSR